MMNWTALLLIAAALALVVILRRAGLIATRAAREHLEKGALVIDVRTPGEYAAGHLPHVIHLPLDGIETKLPERVPDKNTVLLLHCQSGVRSGIAKRKLKGQGYKNAFNLGSLARAGRVLSGK
jgi:rhodanese-related sulfurtransferase